MKDHELKKAYLHITRILNRQHDKDRGIDLTGRFIKSRFGVEVLFYDFKGDQNQAVVRKVSGSHQQRKTPLPIERPIKDYRKILYLKGKEEIDPYFGDSRRMFSISQAYTIPIISRSDFKHLLMVYITGSEEISNAARDFGRFAARELVAFLTRIQRSNHFYQAMLFRVNYLENILSYQNNQADMGQIMRKMVRDIPKAIAMKKCTIALLDKKKEYLLPYYSNFLEPEAGVKYPMDKSLVTDHTGILALEKKEPIIVYDARTDPRCDRELAEELNIYSNVTVPILNLQGNPLGVMYVDNEQYEIFTKEQIRFLKIIGGHIGLILSNLNYIDRLQSEVQRDGLTGLYNKESFLTLYQEYFEGREKSSPAFSLMMLDIDNFKGINDTCGHILGDRFIKAFGEAMKKSVRDKDLVGRYGGEEFMILLKDTDRGAAQHIGERIRRNIEEILIEGVSTTISIGLAVFPGDGDSGKALLETADRHLYRAKKEGKNRIAVRAY